MTADEVVAHAISVTEKTFAAYRDRGWLVEAPTWEEALAQARKRDEERLNDPGRD